jgi:hypothetical protein
LTPRYPNVAARAPMPFGATSTVPRRAAADHVIVDAHGSHVSGGGTSSNGRKAPKNGLGREQVAALGRGMKDAYLDAQKPKRSATKRAVVKYQIECEDHGVINPKDYGVTAHSARCATNKQTGAVTIDRTEPENPRHALDPDRDTGSPRRLSVRVRQQSRDVHHCAARRHRRAFVRMPPADQRPTGNAARRGRAGAAAARSETLAAGIVSQSATAA